MSDIIREENQVIVKPATDIVASMANEFKAELQSLVNETEVGITLDLTGVEMVDSVGIGIIIATHNSLNRDGRKLKVTQIPKDIFSLFSTMRLDRHFEMEPAE